MRLLLHVCCAPDMTYPAKLLAKQGVDFYAFFYNPNIHPPWEYFLRLREAEKAAKALGVKFVAGPYRPWEWFERVGFGLTWPEGGERCRRCISFRLEGAARFARAHGFDAFSTVLTISPHKSSGEIFKIGEEIGKRFGVRFIPYDFKKQHGFQESVRLSKELGLYRQNYCGCIYSFIESEVRAALRMPREAPEKTLKNSGFTVEVISFKVPAWRCLRVRAKIDGKNARVFPIWLSPTAEARGVPKPIGEVRRFGKRWKIYRLEDGAVHLVYSPEGIAPPDFVVGIPGAVVCESPEGKSVEIEIESTCHGFETVRVVMAKGEGEDVAILRDLGLKGEPVSPRTYRFVVVDPTGALYPFVLSRFGMSGEC